MIKGILIFVAGVFTIATFDYIRIDIKQRRMVKAYRWHNGDRWKDEK